MHIFGTLLVVIGAVALLNNFGILPGNFWEFFWPVLLVLIGLSLMSRSRCPGCRWNMWKRCEHCDVGKKKEV